MYNSSLELEKVSKTKNPYRIGTTVLEDHTAIELSEEAIPEVSSPLKADESSKRKAGITKSSTLRNSQKEFTSSISRKPKIVTS